LFNYRLYQPLEHCNKINLNEEKWDIPIHRALLNSLMNGQ